MNCAANPTRDEWRNCLHAPETASLAGDDAQAFGSANAEVQGVLQGAPKTTGFAQPGSPLREHMLQQSQPFEQLQQTVLRTHAQNQRALTCLMFVHADRPPTYGNGVRSITSGAGQTYLKA